jgi:hypothetical protein
MPIDTQNSISLLSLHRFLLESFTFTFYQANTHPFSFSGRNGGQRPKQFETTLKVM